MNDIKLCIDAVNTAWFHSKKLQWAHLFLTFLTISASAAAEENGDALHITRWAQKTANSATYK